jgi:hypothetical protein
MASSTDVCIPYVMIMRTKREHKVKEEGTIFGEKAS